MAVDLSAGSQFAGYRIEELVGRGGMGMVYRATQLALERPVALKLIVPEYAADESYRRRFRRESRLAAQLDHPNVIPVYEAGEAQGLLFISMRFVEGYDLRELLMEEGRLAPQRAARIIAELAGALDAAHELGLVHRDVKPANVLLQRRQGEEHAYLTDFGLARQTSSESGLTRSGHWVGTLDYAAPEQFKGQPLDARTDVYALGCLLYEALTGRLPYPLDTDAAKIWAHTSEPPPQVTAAAPDVATGFDQLLARAMAKEPTERHGSAGDLGRAALAAAEGAPLPPEQGAVATGSAASQLESPVDQAAPTVGETAAAADAYQAGKGVSIPAEGETRLLTVLVATSDPAASRPDLDAEDAAELVSQALEVMVDAISTHDGRIISYLIDGVLAAFGTPRAREDDAERAVLTALEIRERLEQLRISPTGAINTGQVYLRPPDPKRHQAPVAAGPVVDLAASLQAEASAGQILVAEATHRLVRHGFDFTRASLPASGTSGSVDAFDVLGRVDVRRKPRGIEGLRADLYGRDEELSKLKESLEDVAKGNGRVLGLVGEAGVGKSRLIAELKELAGEHSPALRWLEGRCQESGTATSYLPFVEVFRSHFGLRVDEDHDAGRQRIDDSLQELIASGDLASESRQTMVPLIGNLLSIRSADGFGAELESAHPEQLKNETFAAVGDFVTSLAKQHPVALVLEDLHWADSLSLDLSSLLLERAAAVPLLLVFSSRPDPERPWKRLSAVASQLLHGRFAELNLRGLSPEESRGLLTTLLKMDALPPQLGEAILEKGQGNPFFLEEILRSLIDSGAVFQQDGAWRVRPDIESRVVPDSIQSVILSRVDQVEDKPKSVLQLASVIGPLVPRSVLAHLSKSPDELEPALSVLEDRELIYRERVVPEEEYRFKHVMTQETVYRSLSRRRRSALHQQVAEAIELLNAGALEARAEQLAFHYDKSASDAKAIEYLHKAGEKSQRAYLNDEATRYFERALQRLTDFSPDGAEGDSQAEHRAQIEEALGDVRQLTDGRHEDALASFQRALAARPRDQALARSRLHRKAAEAWQIQRRYEEAVEAYERAEEALGPESANRAPDWWREWLEVQDARIMLQYWRGEVGEMDELIDRARPVMERYATPTQRVKFFGSITGRNLRRDRYVVSDETLGWSQAALAASRELGTVGLDLGGIRGGPEFMVGFSHLWRREFDEAETHMEAALGAAERTGEVTRQARCLTYLTVAFRMRHQVERARDYALRSRAAAEQSEMHEYVAMADANLAWVAWRKENLDEARERARGALRMWQELPIFGSKYMFEWAALWPLVGVTLRRRQLAEAVDHARVLGDPALQPPPADIEAIVEEAVRFHDAGRLKEAEAKLTQAALSAKELGYL